MASSFLLRGDVPFMVSLTEAALGCLRSIHQGGELAGFLSARSAGRGWCDDGGRGHTGGRCEDQTQRSGLTVLPPNRFVIGGLV